MPRKKNDGRGRLGGRQAGTPNKDNPLKTLLHDHSVDYFTPSIKAEDVDMFPDAAHKADFISRHKGKIFSQYELDLLCMKASDRAKAELDLLNYHTPKMQSISADMSIKDTNLTFTERLLRVARGEDLDDNK